VANSAGERVRFGDWVTDGEDQPIRGGVQDQTHLIGEWTAAAGTIRGELSLVQLDQVLGLWSRGRRGSVVQYPMSARKMACRTVQEH
jgi:hypothetical protein